MERVFCWLTLIIVVWLMWRGVSWMLRVGKNNELKYEPLSPADLKILEETTARLMEELRATADECVARIQKAYISCQSIEQTSSKSAADFAGGESVRSSDITYGSSAESNLTVGEIELMRSLHLCQSRAQDRS
ncbi:MAG: hypothetical protein ACUVRS_08550 [Armatimonadota bacterium]